MNGGARFPYPGLRAFARDESDLFFGRDGCVDAMVDCLAATRFLAVLGASGSGKSSLVRTGLLDALDLGLHPWAGTRWRIADLHPGGQPVRNLAAALLAVGGPGAEPDEESIDLLATFLRRGPRSLAEWVSGGNLPADCNLLLLVDQFEELFRYGNYARQEEAEFFVALLLESTAIPKLRIHTVITMRSEYLGACALMPGLAERINAGLYLAPRMTREECREAIEGPASVMGFRVEPTLVNRLLNDLASFAPWDAADSTDQAERLARRADQLPLMQHVLNRLWSRARTAPASEQGVVLKLTDYDGLGGLSGALDGHGEEVLATLGTEKQEFVEAVFRSLVAGSSLANAVRRPCRVGELIEVAGSREETLEVVEAFRWSECSFLRTSEPSLADDSVIIDVSHESLIRQWSPLRRWLETESRAAAAWQRLVAAQERHQTGEGGLLMGLDCQTMQAWWGSANPTESWARRYGGDFGLVREFLKNSVEEEKDRAALAVSAEAREKRRLRAFALALATGILILAALGLREYQDSGKLAGANRDLKAKSEESQRAREAAEKARLEAEKQRQLAEAERANAVRERDAADREARKTASTLDEISNTIYSDRYRGLVGVAGLQKDLMKTLVRYQSDLAKKHAGVVNIGNVARDDSRRGRSYEVMGDATKALASFAQSYERGLAAVRSNPDPDDSLLENFLENGSLYAWFLFDTGENEDAKRVLQNLKIVRDRIGPHTKSSGLLNAMSGFENLESRYYSDIHQKELAAQHSRKYAEYAEQAAEANPSDIGSLASRRNAYSNLYLETSEAEEQRWVTKECQVAEQIFASNPTDARAVIGRISCLHHKAQIASKQGHADEADSSLLVAEEIALGGLRASPNDQQFLLSLAKLENARGDLLYGANKDDVQFKHRMAAKDYLVRALRDRTILQSNTSEVKDLYNSTKNVTFSDRWIEIAFYRDVMDALAPTLAAFPKAPKLAYVGADASSNLGKILRKEHGWEQEAGRHLTNAIQWFERSKLMEDISDYSQEYAGVCTAYSERAAYYGDTGRLDEMVADVKKLRQVCDPALEKYPWDFYLRSPFYVSANAAGKALFASGRYADAMPHLEYASHWGVGEASTQLARIYREGLGGKTKDEKRAKELVELASRQSMKRFTIPCDFGGVKSPFYVYVREWPAEYPFAGIEDQAKWLEKARGGTVPKEVVEAFQKVHKIARENNVSFPELIARALGDTEKDSPKSSVDRENQQGGSKPAEAKTSEAKPDQKPNLGAAQPAYDRALAFIRESKWVEAAREAESALKLAPDSIEVISLTELIYHEHLFDFSRAYELNQRRVKLGVGSEDFVEKNLTTARFEACVALAGVERPKTKGKRLQIVLDAVQFACLVGTGRMADARNTATLLRNECAGLEKAGWTFTGTKKFLSGHPAFSANAAHWEGLFTALEDGDEKGAKAALSALGVP